jgi:hypothetical protein
MLVARLNGVPGFVRMKRLLARPPKLNLKTSFAEAYRDGRFTQLELFSASELIAEAKKHDLAVRDETLEELDRYGAFTPVAFVGADWAGDFYGPRWNLAAMTFRDEVGYQRWSRYAFREDGVRRVIALYSPWQLMYLKSALEDRLVLLTLPYVLGRRDRLLSGLKNARGFWRVDRDLWQSLEQNWRPLVLLLCWLQNRYLPFVRGRSTMVYVEGRREPVDPVRDELRTFDAAALVDRLGIGVDEIRAAYQQLALIGETRDPIKDWFLVVRAASPRARDKFEGDARLAQLVYDAADVLRRLLHDLTGEVEPDVDEVLGWPRDWKERLLGHERRLVYDRDDLKRILERKRLSPFGVHVFVEGTSDKELIGGLIDAIWGDHRRLGVRFTPLGGISEVARQSTLFEAFSTYARKALLVADDEGKIERDLKRLRAAGLLVDEDEFHGWKRNIEEDNASARELVEIAKGIAADKGATLKLSVAQLSRIRAAVGPKRGLARIICEQARQQDVTITKDELAVALRELILKELEQVKDEKQVSEHRPALGLALAIGRYSASS